MTLRLCPQHARELVPARSDFGKLFVCPESGCNVRCWGGSTSTPATKETMRLRQSCHAKFDFLWLPHLGKKRKPNPHRRFGSRKAAYRWLGESMGLAPEQAHFGMFTADQCREALRLIDGLRERP